jgi:hypothetical protein
MKMAVDGVDTKMNSMAAKVAKPEPSSQVQDFVKILADLAQKLAGKEPAPGNTAASTMNNSQATTQAIGDAIGQAGKK